METRGYSSYCNLYSATSMPKLRLFLMDRKENYIVCCIWLSYIVLIFFPGREDPTAPTWGGAFGGGLYCVPPGVYHGRLHQPSVYLWGADDNYQLHQNRGHSGRAHLHQGRSLELLPQVRWSIDQNIFWLFFASNYNNTNLKDFLGINCWSKNNPLDLLF